MTAYRRSTAQHTRDTREGRQGFLGSFAAERLSSSEREGSDDTEGFVIQHQVRSGQVRSGRARSDQPQARAATETPPRDRQTDRQTAKGPTGNGAGEGGAHKRTLSSEGSRNDDRGGAAELAAALRFVCEGRDAGWARWDGWMNGRAGGDLGAKQLSPLRGSACLPEEYALPQIRSTTCLSGSLSGLLAGCCLAPSCSSTVHTQLNPA